MSRSFDAIIIGAGQAGPSLAGRLTAAGMKVALIERKYLGGTCVNTGCMPTKAMVASAYAAHLARRAGDYGVSVGREIAIDMKKVHARAAKITLDSRSGLENWLTGMENCMPDIITMAKALTNGAIPMGAVAASDAIYETITNAAPETAIELFHGYTYSGHPAACAAGLATLRIYENEGIFERAAKMSDYFLDAIWSLKDLSIVRDLRGYGMMAGVEVFPDEGKPGARGTELQKKLFWNGCHIKWTGDTAIIAPSLVTERSQIDEIVDCLRRTLMEL